jgi:hypothetical protein
MPIISVVRKWRQEDQEFKASLGYTMRPNLKKTKTNKQKSRCTFNSLLGLYQKIC